MKKIILSLFIVLISTIQLSAQALTATATPSPAACPSSGSIVVNASGGTPTYYYSVIGPVTKLDQTSNIFNDLTAGTYTVEVLDKDGTKFTIPNVVVTTTYRKMFATAVANTELCGGSNTGSITMSLRTSSNDVGTPPYTYQIVTAPAGQALISASNISATTYSFTNLIPGSYRISVTDACSQTQALDVVLNPGTYHNNAIKAWAYTAPDCSTTDYYLQPQIGAYYPHTFYAYLNGDLTSTPTKFTFTSGAQLVNVPGANTQAFKVTLPTPSPFYNGKYTFKYTDICNTDVNSVRVQPLTVTLGDFQTTTSVVNCQRMINVKIGNGWKFPVTATAVPVGGGTTLTGTSSDPNQRTISIPGGVSGKTYTVTVTDDCTSHTVPTQNVIIPDLQSTLTITPYQEIGGNLDGVKSLTVQPGSGWQFPVTGTLTNGPTSYFSTLLNQTISSNIPISNVQGSDGYVRFRNLIPGTYTLRLTDACNNTKDFTITIDNNNLQSFNFPPLTWSGCPGSQKIFSTASSKYGGMSADVYTANNNIVASGMTNPTFNLQVPYGDYYVKYLTPKNTAEVFVNPNNDGTTVTLKRLDINVPFLSAYPEIGDYGLSQCDGSSTIWVALYKSSNSSDIYTFSIEKTSGAGDFYTPQSSNLFELNDYGQHRYKVSDVCGNVNEGVIEISPNTKPRFASDKCLTAANLQLSTRNRPNTTYKWIKPDGTVVDGNTLLVGTRTTLETYKLISTYTVGSCSEKDTTVFTLPLPSITKSDTIVHQKPYEFIVPISGLETSMVWYKDNVMVKEWHSVNGSYPAESSDTLKITAPGAYKFVSLYSQSGCQTTTTQNVSFPNYWMGGNGTSIVEKENWADPLNWTNVHVPLANQTNSAQNEDVIFATVSNFKQNAVNDLVLDIDRTVANVTNESPRALIIPTQKTLTIGGIATTGSADQLVLKSYMGQANGALIFAQPANNQNVQATVELSSKSYKGGGTYPRMWQYIGSPIVSAIPNQIFGTDVSGTKYGPASSVLIRKYDESKNDANDVGDKFIEGTSVSTAMDLFHGYEVVKPVTTHTDDPIYSFKGVLNVQDHTSSLTFTPKVYYRGNFLLANSYAAPIFIDNLTDDNFVNLEQTIYIYNTGSRDEWIAGGSGLTPGSNAGQYFSIPIEVAKRVAGYPLQISSIQGFLVRRLSNLQGYDNTKNIEFKFLYNSIYRPAGNTIGNEPMRVKSQSETASVQSNISKNPLLSIDLAGAKSADRVFILTEPGTKKSFDNGWDGTKFNYPETAQIYVKNNDERFQVSTDSDIDQTIIGIGAGGESELTLQFSLKDMDEVYRFLEIVDLQTGSKQAISDGGKFRFTVNQNSPEARFRINAVKNISGDTNQNLSLFTNGQTNEIVVKNERDENGILRVTDVSGKLILERDFVPGISTHSLNLQPGVYVVNAYTKSDKTAIKFVVKQ